MKFVISLVFLVSSFQANASGVVDYSSRYGVRDLYTKIVDNRGEGNEALYGVRNARMVFKNILRGGANNVYHRTHPRDNHNPLQEDALDHLCREGFTEANYLYPTGFSSAPHEVRCTLPNGKPSSIRYLNLKFGSGKDEEVLKLVRRHLMGETEGGLYLHCWNGWHASGYMSAISLIQFCGMSQSDAVDYWHRNTDGVNSGPHYELIRGMIRQFKPIAGLALPAAVKDEVCL